MLIFLTALIAMVVFYIIYVETMFTSTGDIVVEKEKYYDTRRLLFRTKRTGS